MKIPVTVLVMTKNEAKRIEACLAALVDFADIIVMDSQSRDTTVALAQAKGARVVDFIWNGHYPKKRQWCLDALPLQTDWIFFVDADEIVTPELIAEIRRLFEDQPRHDGYFIKGLYRIDGKVLRHGISNNKIVLLRRDRFRFPVIDDLDIPGMGEMEGHYQPLPVSGATIGQLRHGLIHDALENERDWAFRHEKYARWEAGVNRRQAWPVDPVPGREFIKRWLRRTALRPQLMFLISFVGKGGWLDGRAGLKLARSRYRYYQMIQRLDRSA